MSRLIKYLALPVLVLFVLACNAVTQPFNQAQALAGTAQSIARAMPMETLQSLATQITTQVPVETLEALPSMASTFDSPPRSPTLATSARKGRLSMIEDEDLLLDVIDLSGMAEGPRQLDRLRGRIIGKDGRAREQIEDMTDVEISVYGKTIALIGYPEQLKTARAAIDMLIEGVPHENVFAFLDRKKKEAKQDMISYYY